MTAPTTPAAPRRKLIEVSLPLEAINRESAREKSIRHGHPSTLHLWWARRPLAAARAVLFAQLVDDPSCDARALEIEDEEDRERWVSKERARLHGLIERMVVWENTGDEALFTEAHREILRCTDGKPPPVLDPFAGGGSIPLEAQRLGLEAHASDLNPVAVLINKALIEIPPKFAGQPPVFPGAAEAKLTWPKATGLAEDVRRYGEWMRDRAKEQIGHLYPDAVLPDGTTAPVIAWIWARTVTCPNPACGIAMPLVRSWWLGKKKGKEAYVVPVVEGRRVRFTIGHDPLQAPTADTDGTVARTGAFCVRCDTAVPFALIRAEGQAGRLHRQLMVTVAEGKRRRVYLEPTAEDEKVADVARPANIPDELVPIPSHDVDRLPMYGMFRWSDAFTARQLQALTTFGDSVAMVRIRARTDALAAGLTDGAGLEAGGIDAAAYADAVTTYLGLATSTVTDDLSSLVTWRPSHGTGATRSAFARQALPMTWDFAEANPFSHTAGDLSNTVPGVATIIDRLPSSPPGHAVQQDAHEFFRPGSLISTDPPYYDNIGYSDLSDYFYVWLRRHLQKVHPEGLSTVVTPKKQELIANPYRHHGAIGARQYFEAGFERVFNRARETALDAFPITVYYAFKQSESDDLGEASTGWETLLGAMVRSGWGVTATWPIRSERAGRMSSVKTNALASAIVLALRPRAGGAPTTDRRGFLAALRAELPEALRELQQGAIAPVDLPQAAIGPGMAVFTRYGAVLDSDGSPMPVRAALAQINAMLDEVLTAQENNFDGDTRFAVQWFRQNGFAVGAYGDADNLARARGANIGTLARSGTLTSHAGKVQLLVPSALPTDYDPATDPHITVWEVVLHLTRVLASHGVPDAAALMARVPGSVDLAIAKELAYLLFDIAETRGQTADAVAFNALAAAWNEITAASRGYAVPATQPGFDFAAAASDDDALV